MSPEGLILCNASNTHGSSSVISGLNAIKANYRPITLLSVFHKIMEKVMYKRLVNFLDNEFVFILGTLIPRK